MAVGERPAPSGEIRFERKSPLLQLALVTGGAITFLGGAAFLLAIVLSGGAGSALDALTLLFMVAGFAFFGLLLASGAYVALRGGLSRTALAVGPQGIWMPGLERLAWDDIAEVRLESYVAPVGGENATAAGRPLTANYRRLGIVPRDSSIAARRPGVERMGWGLMRAYYRFAAPLVRRQPIEFAPFGVSDLDLAVPLELVVDAIRPYHAVVGVSDQQASAPAGEEEVSSAAAALPPDAFTTVHVGGRDIVIPRAEPRTPSDALVPDVPAHSAIEPTTEAASATDGRSASIRRRYLSALSMPRGPSTAPPVMPLWASSTFLAFGLIAVWVTVAGLPGSGALPFGLFGLLFGGIGGYFAWRAVRTAWLRRRLSQTGVTTNAEVIGLVNRHVQVNDVEMWVVHYGYQVPGGTRVGVSPSMPYAQASAWSPGDTVRIAYDPNDPGMSMWLAR